MLSLIYKVVELASKVIDLETKLSNSRAANTMLEAQVEELEWKADGYVKCVHCDGDGGKHTRRGSHGPDPQSWEDCPNCKGEGWVKEEEEPSVKEEPKRFISCLD